MRLFINAETNEFVTELLYYSDDSIKASLTKKDDETIEVEMLQYINNGKGCGTNRLFSFLIKISDYEEIKLEMELLQNAINIMADKINDVIKSAIKESKNSNDVYILSIYGYIARHHEFCMNYKIQSKKVIYNRNRCDDVLQMTTVPVIN